MLSAVSSAAFAAADAASVAAAAAAVPALPDHYVAALVENSNKAKRQEAPRTQAQREALGSALCKEVLRTAQ